MKIVKEEKPSLSNQHVFLLRACQKQKVTFHSSTKSGFCQMSFAENKDSSRSLRFLKFLLPYLCSLDCFFLVGPICCYKARVPYGPIVYRLGHQVFILARGVRLPLGLLKRIYQTGMPGLSHILAVSRRFQVSHHQILSCF